MNILYPEQYAASVRETDYGALWNQGVRFLLFDVDNTLATYNTALPDAAIKALFHQLKEKGFQTMLLSNGKEHRVERFAAALEAPYIYRAMKPLPGGIRRAMKKEGYQKEQTALIGDQIFTDVLGANWAGIHAVLTRPISVVDDEWITRIKRGLEKRVIAGYLKKKGKTE